MEVLVATVTMSGELMTRPELSNVSSALPKSIVENSTILAFLLWVSLYIYCLVQNSSTLVLLPFEVGSVGV